MRNLKKNTFLLSLILFISTGVNAKSVVEKIDFEKICSYLKEENAIQHCKNEQMDELIIKETKGKNFKYIIDNINEINNKIKTPLGLQYFIDQLEQSMLSAKTFDLKKDKQKEEYENAKYILDKMQKKYELMKENYVLSLALWSENENEQLNKYALNRLKIQNESESKLKKMQYWTKSFDIYINNKKIAKNFMIPLYLGEIVEVNKKDCDLIKFNIPELFEKKKNNIRGC